MSVILGIDLGTSSVKAMLLDSVKGVISVEKGMRSRIRRHGGWRQNRYWGV